MLVSNIFQLEFWTYATNHLADKETISMLYQNNLLDITTPPKICFFIPEVISTHKDQENQEDQEINNEEMDNAETKFWKSFS